MQTSRADSPDIEANKEGQKPSLFAISLPSLFHFGGIYLVFDYCLDVMLSILESLWNRYDITIGVFDNTEYASSDENRNFAVLFDSDCIL